MFPRKYFSKPFASSYFRRLLVLVFGQAGRVELFEQILLRIIPTDFLAWVGYGTSENSGSILASEELLSSHITSHSQSSPLVQEGYGSSILSEEIVWEVEE